MTIVDLVQVTTRDGVRLDGVLQDAAAETTASLGVDAALLVHGTGTNFYGSTMMEYLATRFTSAGVAALRVNTRGHDGMSTAATAKGTLRQGAAYEIVSDCRHDIVAWLNLLHERGHKKLALVGHSLGALKAIYAQAYEQVGPVTRLVAISPPRLSHARFAVGPWGADFVACYREAEAHLAAGTPQTLMEIHHPLPYTVSAEGFVDKYHRDERYDIVTHLPRIAVPLLATFGSQELVGHPAFAGLPEAIERLDASPSGSLSHGGDQIARTKSREVAVIAGTDHFYAGARSELAARIEKWLRRLAADEHAQG